MTVKKGGSMMRDPEKEYENAQDVMMEMKARDEDMTGRRRGLMTNLKRIIDENGVQQRWLAEQIGVTEVSMSRYVSGERIPKAPIAIRMADALGVNVKDLYGWESEKRTEERTETHACDCISRQAAIDAHYEYCNKHPDAGFPVWSLKILEDLPSAQPERETAKFIRWMECKKTANYISYTPHCKCSKCGTEFLIETIKYCYMCGARMEDSKE